jgi:hypothetical protein
MRLRLIPFAIAVWLICPSVSNADAILYTLTTNYASVNNAAPDSVVDWQFATTSVLTGSTVIGSFLSTSVGGDFTGCNIASAIVPSSAGITSPAVTSIETSFASPCSTIPNAVGLPSAPKANAAHIYILMSIQRKDSDAGVSGNSNSDLHT